ncbi:leucine-rich repeat protein 1-like [Neocloeon triangulifer]|uniref:leucine-rich repeat protein 1-like n=1 Tax=Neocloeon triangulifer TaxID=2078957 RepID=UPI00286F3544|nr:leucine-rich repeat protein 1-like [Neocloeon triangulifer]
MKLICDLVVNNLQYAGLSVPKNRAKKCQVSVIKSSNNELTMVAQSADNKNGINYKLTGNVTQTFEKFVLEGKCTIRLKKPLADLILSKCDVMQLRLFLKTIQTGEDLLSGSNSQAANKKGNNEDSRKRLIDSLPSSQKKLKLSNFNEKCRTKLIILSKKELITTSFSQTLVELQIPDLGLSMIPPSVSRLAKLQTLDVSGNNLTDLPRTFSSKLTSLNLKGNQLDRSNSKTWRFFSLPNIRNSLSLLNLQENRLPALPLEILSLEKLSTLNVSHNKIKKFASSIGDLPRLRDLDVSHNVLSSLDISFKMLKLASLDVTGNSFSHPVDKQGVNGTSSVPSLKRIACALVRNHRINHNILPKTVQEELLLMRRCKCFKVVGSTDEQYIINSVKNLAQTCVFDGTTHLRMHYSSCNGCEKSQISSLRRLI